MAWDVDEREGGAVDDGVREAEVDGDAARLLFLQPIRVDARQRVNERALPVIDVARGSDDDGSHERSPGHGDSERGDDKTTINAKIRKERR